MPEVTQSEALSREVESRCSPGAAFMGERSQFPNWEAWHRVYFSPQEWAGWVLGTAPLSHRGLGWRAGVDSLGLCSGWLSGMGFSDARLGLWPQHSYRQPLVMVWILNHVLVLTPSCAGSWPRGADHSAPPGVAASGPPFPCWRCHGLQACGAANWE